MNLTPGVASPGYRGPGEFKIIDGGGRLGAPRISVVITCFNKARTLEACISSIYDQAIDGLEVVVVDDGSTDDSLERASKFSGLENFRLLKLPHNGISSAKNEGIRASRGNIVLFLDGDCILERGALERVLGIFEAGGDGLGCVGGEVRALNGSRSIARTIELIQNEFPRKWPFGANVAFRREVLERLGGFDTGMEYGEDADLFLRMRKAGYGYVMAKSISARTENPESLFALFKQRYKWGKGFAQLIDRHPELFDNRVKLCFALNYAILASLISSAIHPLALLAFFSLFAINLLRFLPSALGAYRISGERSHLALVPIVKATSALAYSLSWLVHAIGRPRRADRRAYGSPIQGTGPQEPRLARGYIDYG
jgi:cellulose synthase/poly-beta-1,6-N-acetylglucosamine synthase-like glycosyltransferase